MKQFIVLMAILPIMLVFVIQIGHDQKNGEKINRIQSVVYAGKEKAKQEGCFTPQIKSDIKSGIEKSTGIPASEIKVISDGIVKHRYDGPEGRLIHYRVEVPIDDVMAATNFFRISDHENRYKYVIDSYTAGAATAATTTSTRPSP